MTVFGITGASGALGRRTAEYILESHPEADVVLITRSPQSIEALSDKGVTIRCADFDQPEELSTAFAGIDTLLLISTQDVGRRVRQHTSAIAAAAQAGVSRIVYTSMTDPFATYPERLRVLADEHAVTEKVLQEAGPAWTVLRNALYFEALPQDPGDAVKTGKIYSNRGEGRHSPVARDDCAAAAAAVLTSSGHDHAVYDIAGPQIIDDNALADTLSHHLQNEVTVCPVTDEEWAQRFARATDAPDQVVQMVTGFGETIRAGLFETPLGDTEKLIGRSPLSYGDFLSGKTVS